MELDFLKDVLDFSHQRITKMNVVAENSSDSYPVAIYCSLIELAKSYYTLVSNLDFTGSLSVARTFFENYVELSILLDEPDHSDHMYFEFYHSKNRILKNVRQSGREIELKYISLENERSKIETELKRFGEKCGRRSPIQIRDKFSKAGLEDLYVIMYADLCAESHCNLSALFNRHFNVDGETGTLGISIYKTDDTGRYYSVASITALLLIKIGRKLVSKRGCTLTPDYEEMEIAADKRFNEIHPD